LKAKPNKKNGKYSQGIYTLRFPEKYKGSTPVVYRSGAELKVMRWLDSSTNVTMWGSESVVVPYESPADGKIHRYFIDFVCHMVMKDGTTKKLLIEYKPEKQTRPPEASNRKKPSTMLYERYHWAINQAKWQAATAWGLKKGYQFIVLTEKHLGTV
jgi:hypothetical protein